MPLYFSEVIMQEYKRNQHNVMARQYHGVWTPDIPAIIAEFGVKLIKFSITGELTLRTEQGVIKLVPSDYIIKSNDGVVAVCSEDYFTENYTLYSSEEESDEKLLADIRADHAAWSAKQFGDIGALGPLRHLKRGIDKVMENPNDLLEWADMQLLFWDGRRRAGVSDTDLCMALAAKMEANKARSWWIPIDEELVPHKKDNTEIHAERSVKRIELMDLFEAHNKLPHGVIRVGESYSGVTYENRSGSNFIEQFEGFVQGYLLGQRHGV